jgi:hypothetical protein
MYLNKATFSFFDFWMIPKNGGCVTYLDWFIVKQHLNEQIPVHWNTVYNKKNFYSEIKKKQQNLERMPNKVQLQMQI